MLDALRLSGGPGRVEDEQRMLGVHPRRLAGIRLVRDGIVPPNVAPGLHRDRRACALVDEYRLDALASAQRQRFVDDLLQRDLAAAPELPVGGDDGHRARIDDAFLDALCREAAEHHRVRGADARACLHGDHRLDRHRHVDENAVTFLDALRLQRVREAADVVIELLVGDAGDRAVVGFEDDRDLAGLRREMPVEAVVRRVHFAVGEPLEERRVRLVERLRERLVPQELRARMLRPEALEVAFGFCAHGFVGGHSGDVGLLDEGLGRREYAVFLQDRLDTGRHGGFSSANDL